MENSALKGEVNVEISLTCILFNGQQGETPVDVLESLIV